VFVSAEGVREIMATIADMRDAVRALKGASDQATAAIDTLHGQVTTLTASVADLNATIEQLRAQGALSPDAQAMLDESFSDVVQEATDLTNAVNTALPGPLFPAPTDNPTPLSSGDISGQP
jgi:phage shock protein A